MDKAARSPPQRSRKLRLHHLWLTNRLGGLAIKGPGLGSENPKGCLLKHMPVRARIVFVYKGDKRGQEEEGRRTRHEGSGQGSGTSPRALRGEAR